MRVLIDTGASHNFVAAHHIRNMTLQPGKQKVTLADGSKRSVQTGSCHLQIDEYQAEITANVIELCEDFDIILGDTWCKRNHAAVMFGYNQCHIVVEETQVQHQFTVPPYMTTATSTKHAKLCVVVVADKKHAEKQQSRSEGQSKNANAQSEGTFEGHIEMLGLSEDIHKLVDEYKDVFPHTLPSELPPERSVAHAIPLVEGARPVSQRGYRLSRLEEQEVQSQIKDLMGQGLIQHSQSPYGSPILFVKKKDGGLRMCVDFRALNKMTVRNSYPLPRIDDLFDELRNAQVFSCLDLQQAYHQVRLRDDDTPKTAFVTPKGLYEYKVLCFGLTNAPATFQALMNEVLREQVGRYCLVYLDDILVYRNTPEEHLQHLKEVLAALKLYSPAICKVEQVQICAQLCPVLGACDIRWGHPPRSMQGCSGQGLAST